MSPARKCGHPDTEANTLWKIRGGRRIRNGCRACRNAKVSARAKQKRLEQGSKPRPAVADFPEGMKRCAACLEVKTLEEFYPRKCRPGSYLRGRMSECIPCCKSKVKVWRKQNPGKQEAWNREGNIRRRIQVLTHYSGGVPECACCGETFLMMLAIDHIDGGGSVHRRTLRADGSSGETVRDLLRRGLPDGFQVLCHNCNFAKHLGGSRLCPCPRGAARRSEASA